MNIDIIAGARPNFMKISPIIRQIHRYNDQHPATPFHYRLIHTGQHYDRNMSGSFFEQLGIPEPHINLGAGSGSQATQTAQIMIGYEKALEEWKPDLCIVVGDVNSTMACSIVAKKGGIKVAHVEAGIRSGDWSMPEEINRIVTDSLADYFFTTSEIANQHLLQAGSKRENIFYVGNTMIDSLLAHIHHLRQPEFFKELLDDKKYLVLTLHRPSNVDKPEELSQLLRIINDSAGDHIILFPIHPRTRKVFDKIEEDFDRIMIVEPLGYLEFIYTIRHSAGVITDSGGITEETSILNIPCITLRDSTERPETITLGTNELVSDPELLSGFVKKMVGGEWKQTQPIKYWDGRSAERIIEVLTELDIRRKDSRQIFSHG
jgi:UDP-N-acetylglucosamine 2-epimerase (non-hydrolysing)